MPYTLDKNLEAGMKLLAEGKNINAGLRLINQSAKNGTTKGKSYFEIGKIIREGVPGLSANVEESRRYFDAAVEKFRSSPCDAMDLRELGDIFCYGYGTEPVDKNKALEYYDVASAQGDKLAYERAEEVRRQLSRGSATAAPALTVQEEPSLKEEKAEEAAGAETSAASEELSNVEAVTAAPEVESSAQVVKTDDERVNAVIASDQMLIKALRALDDADANEEAKKDAVTLAESASEAGSMRAAILLGYLFEGDNKLVDADFIKAKEQYEKAISEGSTMAQFRLGILYTDELSPYYDVDKGHELILSSARGGNAWALCYLGDCFRVKVDDVRNLEVAYRYYALAGERGLGLAFHNMSEIDASRQQLELAKSHEAMAVKKGYDPKLGYQDPAFYSLHI